MSDVGCRRPFPPDSDIFAIGRIRETCSGVDRHRRLPRRCPSSDRRGDRPDSRRTPATPPPPLASWARGAQGYGPVGWCCINFRRGLRRTRKGCARRKVSPMLGRRAPYRRAPIALPRRWVTIGFAIGVRATATGPRGIELRLLTNVSLLRRWNRLKRPSPVLATSAKVPAGGSRPSPPAPAAIVCEQRSLCREVDDETCRQNEFRRAAYRASARGNDAKLPVSATAVLALPIMRPPLEVLYLWGYC